MRKHLLLLAALLAVVTSTSAQTYRVHKTNGEVVRYENDEVAYIDFVVEKEIKPVDLGLTSGTLWSPVNIGATAPEEYGDYFAWGECFTKDMYNLNTYTHCDDGNTNKMHEQPGKDLAGTQYDAAHVLWEKDWVMPTTKQFEELIAECSAEFITVNEVKGCRFTGSNGNSIFIPFAGRYYEKVKDTNVLDNAGSWGYYWSATRDEYYATKAELLYVGGTNTSKILSQARECGYPVRPVVNPKKE